MSETVLLCTVGGSHQPILTALREIQPAYVCFFCTGNDPATGARGSRLQIEGKGKPVESRKADGSVEKLPNIPTLASLAETGFEVREVPADDLDGAVRIMLDAIAELAERFPDAPVTADYTGGTKTMIAALVMAALESERVGLRLVTGARGNLVSVHDGSQASLEVSAEGIRLRRAMAPYLAAWGRYAYGEAAEGLSRLPVPRTARLRNELQAARDLSRAFDAWDRFDHADAFSICEVYRPRLGPVLGSSLKFLSILSAPDDPRRAPARLWDLWLNAQRRGAQGRYDDAVARLYRLIEWTAQLLLAGKGIDTSDLKPEQLPAGMSVTPGRGGKLQAGLFAAWELVAHHLSGIAAEFATGERDHMLDHLLARNASILAHGETPVERTAWERFASWVEGALLPVLTEEAKRAGLRMVPEQLPDHLPTPGARGSHNEVR
jgi:hypothetical protein